MMHSPTASIRKREPVPWMESKKRISLMRAYDPRFPQVCMDESTKQLLKDKRESLSGQPGQPERVDYAFARSRDVQDFPGE